MGHIPPQHIQGEKGTCVVHQIHCEIAFQPVATQLLKRTVQSMGHSTCMNTRVESIAFAQGACAMDSTFGRESGILSRHPDLILADPFVALPSWMMRILDDGGGAVLHDGSTTGLGR